MPRRVALQTLIEEPSAAAACPQHLWRVLGADGQARVPVRDDVPAVPHGGVEMPSASTELEELLADDRTVCVHAPRLQRSDAGEAAAPLDADLAEVAQRWPTLPRAVRAGILALARADAAE